MLTHSHTRTHAHTHTHTHARTHTHTRACTHTHARTHTHRTTGTVSENFVRLNMKIKRYTKKPGRITGSAYKRKMWKKYQKGGTSSFGGNSSFRSQGTSGSNLCFKCGQPGHWAKNCTEKIGSKNLGKFSGEKVQFGSLPEEQIDAASLEKLAKESPFPSVEAAALMARGIKPSSIGGVKGVSSNLSEAESLLNQGKGGDLQDGDSCGDSGGEEGGGRGKVTSSFVPPPPIHLSPSPPQSGVEPLLQTVDGELIGEISQFLVATSPPVTLLIMGRYYNTTMCHYLDMSVK